MSHDELDSERERVERVIEILEHAAHQFEAGGHLPLRVLTDAVAFIHRSEETAYEAAQGDEDEPALSRCLEHHTAVRRPLSAMHVALDALARGDASANARFAGAVHDYVNLRCEHLRTDDRFVARDAHPSPVLEGPATPVELVENPDTRRLYDRVVEAAALLDIGVPTAFPNARSGRSKPA
ncbi:MAG: hypothetical protein ABI818_16700 [Acidobacteriota bacterium]